jgi:hypothetical protein
MLTNKAVMEIDFSVFTSTPVKKKTNHGVPRMAGLSVELTEKGTEPINFREKLMQKLASYNFLLTPQQQNRVLCIFEWAIIIDDFYNKTQNKSSEFTKHFKILVDKAQHLIRLSSEFEQMETTFQVGVNNKTAIVFTGTPAQVFSIRHAALFENFHLFNGENPEEHLQKQKVLFKYRRAKLVETEFVDGIKCQCYTSIFAGASAPRHSVTITLVLDED